MDAGVVDQRDDGDQHEQAAHQGEQEELDRGIDLSGPSPDPDDEVHRDEHGLPEHIEQEEVRGAEDTGHAGLQEQQRGKETAFAVADIVPARDDDDAAEQRGEKDEQGRDAVDAEAVVNVEAPDPQDVLGELHAGQVGVEAQQHDGRKHESGERDEKRHQLVETRPALAEGHDDEHADERQVDDGREDREARLLGPAHYAPQMYRMRMISTNRPANVAKA